MVTSKKDVVCLSRSRLFPQLDPEETGFGVQCLSSGRAERKNRMPFSTATGPVVYGTTPKGMEPACASTPPPLGVGTDIKK